MASPDDGDKDTGFSIVSDPSLNTVYRASSWPVRFSIGAFRFMSEDRRPGPRISSTKCLHESTAPAATFSSGRPNAMPKTANVSVRQAQPTPQVAPFFFGPPAVLLSGAAAPSPRPPPHSHGAPPPPSPAPPPPDPRLLLQKSRHVRRLSLPVPGAGFAGLSVAWHLLKHSPKDSRVSVDVYDENGVGGGASGVSGGLLHPYSPKAKLLWRGAEFWKESMDLLRSAEQANGTAGSDGASQDDDALIWRRGILRPPTTKKAADILLENAQSCLQSCSLQVLDSDAAQRLIPGLRVPLNLAVYMPLALNINPKKYLQALFFACQRVANESSVSPSEQKEFNLYHEHIDNLQQFSGDYDAVIVCLGGRASLLPELTNKLPLRTCRGVIAEFQLPSDTVEKYGSQSPSILSDAWMAFQGPCTVSVGSTWQWKSDNYASSVSDEEARTAVGELLPKASAVYPELSKWDYVRARAGIRAMPPLTANGSLPLLGRLNDVIGERSNCAFWLVAGLGARGLLYHGLAGKLTAKAVVSGDETVIPSEFTCWKAIKASW